MKTFVLALLLAAFAGSAFAQTFGEITGRVSDPSGAPVPGTSVTVTNTATNAIRQTVTTDSGDYTIPSLPPGVYRIKLEHAGFKSTASDNLQVQVQQVMRLDAT